MISRSWSGCFRSRTYDFGYNFNISDMGTIMKDKDKGLRLALGG